MARGFKYKIGKILQIPYYGEDGAEVLVNGEIRDRGWDYKSRSYYVVLQGPHSASLWLKERDIAKLCKRQPQQ